MEKRMAKFWTIVPKSIKEGTLPEFKRWLKKNYLRNPEHCGSELDRRKCAEGQWKWKSLTSKLWRAGIHVSEHKAIIAKASSSKGNFILTTKAIEEIAKERRMKTMQAKRKYKKKPKNS